MKLPKDKIRIVKFFGWSIIRQKKEVIMKNYLYLMALFCSLITCEKDKYPPIKKSQKKIITRPIGEELKVPSKETLGLSYMHQYSPNIAFGDKIYFAVWLDHRYSPNLDTAQLFGTRIKEDGQIIDKHGINLCSSDHRITKPQVAYNSKEKYFLIIWENNDRNKIDIYGLAVDARTGRILGQSCGFRISQGEEPETNPGLAFDGKNFLVIWQREDPEEDWNLYGRLIGTNQQGRPQPGRDIVINASPGDQINPTITFDGRDFLIAWEDKRSENNLSHIYFNRIRPSENYSYPTEGDADGFLLNDLTSERNKSQIQPQISQGNFYSLITYSEFSAGQYQIRGTRIENAPQTPSIPYPRGVPITRLNFPFQAKIAPVGPYFLIVWLDNNHRGVLARLIREANGEPIEQEPTRLGATGLPVGIMPTVSVASKPSSSQALVSWPITRMWRLFPEGDIFGLNLKIEDRTITPSSRPFHISTSPPFQITPKAAFAKETYATIFYSPDGIRIACFKKEDSNLIKNTLITSEIISDKVPFPRNLNMNIATDGEEYLVVWDHMGNIYGKKVRANDCTPQNKFTILEKSNIGSIGSLPIAYANGKYLVVWQDFNLASNKFVLNAAFIKPDMIEKIALEESPIPGGPNFLQLQLGSDGRDFLVTWLDHQSYLYGAIISSQTQSIRGDFFFISLESISIKDLKIAYGNGLYVLVWQDGEDTLWFTTVTQEGEPSAGFFGVSEQGQNPAIVFDKAGEKPGFIISWFDGQGKILGWGLQFQDQDLEFFGEPFEISEAEFFHGLALTSDTQGQSIIFYSDLREEDQSYRLKRRIIGRQPLGIPCDPDFSKMCQSGFCVDNVCCNEKCDEQCKRCDITGYEGYCKPIPNEKAVPCDDKNKCTSNDKCIDGTCQGEPKICEPSSDPCQKVECNRHTGKCESSNLSDGTPCEDEVYCNGEEICQSGKCIEGKPIDCSHLNDECHIGQCNEQEKKCVKQPISDKCCRQDKDCDDNNPCTKDICQERQCIFVFSKELCPIPEKDARAEPEAETEPKPKGCSCKIIPNPKEDWIYLVLLIFSLIYLIKQRR
jgi:hypothetical protein